MATQVICLDTNYFILGLVPGSRESVELRVWIEGGETLVAPMPVWYEFLCGPVSARQVQAMRAFLQALIPFEEPQAAAAAALFNATGRKRGTRVDAMIAATAIVAGATLATNNRKDFGMFTASGLRLT